MGRHQARDGPNSLFGDGYGKRPNLSLLIRGEGEFFLTVSLRVEGVDMGAGWFFWLFKAIYGGVYHALP